MNATAAEGQPPWFERRAKRREWELAEFEAEGLPATERVENGRLWIDTEVTLQGESVAVHVRYPVDYPDFPPKLFAAPGLLARHQGGDGNLCVLEDPANDWWPGWSAAQVVAIKLQALFEDTEQGPDAIEAGEADMVESISAEISHSPGEAVLVPDPFWGKALELPHGEFAISELDSTLQVLVSVDGMCAIDDGLLNRLHGSGKTRRVGVWVQLPEPPPAWPSDDQILSAALAIWPGLYKAIRDKAARNYKNKKASGWVAVTFLEEGPQRGQSRRAWTFFELSARITGQPDILRSARPQPLTQQARELRTPELAGLSEARIWIVGAGSLGAPLLIELAKAGVGTIDICDSDFFEASSNVRHVLPTIFAGDKKVDGLRAVARELNPFVTVNGYPHEMRGNAVARLAVADLVIDTTGSQNVGRMLSRACRDIGKTLIVAGVSNGAYGGDVVILRPDGPCFMCLTLAQGAGEIPTPRSGPRSNATPVGCVHPAFSGAGFDATALAAVTARIALGLSSNCTYPVPEFDWVVMNFRGSDPWQQGRLEKQSGCPICGDA